MRQSCNHERGAAIALAQAHRPRAAQPELHKTHDVAGITPPGDRLGSGRHDPVRVENAAVSFRQFTAS